MSSFDSTDLFGSGPHRFLLGPRGDQLFDRTRIDPYASGFQANGPLDGAITVRGRLVANSPADLWALIDTISTKLTHAPLTADLIDNHAHTHKDMSFIAFTPLGPIDQGRQCSLPYEARFQKFGAWS